MKEAALANSGNTTETPNAGEPTAGAEDYRLRSLNDSYAAAPRSAPASYTGWG